MQRIFIILSVVFFRATISPAQTGGETHIVPAELTGKWCYISRSASTLETITSSCITLNADGTYDMQLDKNLMEGASMPGSLTSDAGTWWVDNGRLFYKSDSQGSGSLRFQKANHPRIENTPVLIVEGAIFCTASPRDPW